MECAAAAAGVVRDPTRNVPRATILGVLGAAALYIAATSAIMGILPAKVLATSDAPFGDAARAALGAALGAAIAACTFLRTGGCVTGWTLVVAETSRGAADQGVFPRVFLTRPGERASAANLLTAGGLTTAFALATATPNLAEQFSTIINAVSLLSIYTYMLAALSLARLAGRFTPGRRAAALANAAAAVAFSALLISGAKPIELALSLAPLPLAALLYLRLRRRDP
jgi:arginine:agmatine antiporter